MPASFPSAECDWPPAVVLGGYNTGVVLMRNLERRGVSVAGVDPNPQQPLFRTVYGKAYLCPDPDRFPDEWVHFMLALAGRMGPEKPVLIASADQFVSAVARHAELLKSAFRFSVASAAIQALLATKESQYAMAAQQGMPIPLTSFIRNAEDLEEFCRRASFPCLLKPLHFRIWEAFPSGHPLRFAKTANAASAAELRAQYSLACAVSPDVVAQEIMQGPDTDKYVYLSCYAQTGERLGACLFRELRTHPMHFGSATVVEPMQDAAVDAMCDRFLRSIGYTGICELELKRDSRDGVVKLIEANPRYSATADAAPYAGVDIGWLHYLDTIGASVTPARMSARHFHHVMLAHDMAAIRSHRAAGLLSWKEILRPYVPPVAFQDFDLRDYRVTLSTLNAVLRNLLYPLARRLRGKRL